MSHTPCDARLVAREEETKMIQASFFKALLSEETLLGAMWNVTCRFIFVQSVVAMV